MKSLLIPMGMLLVACLVACRTGEGDDLPERAALSGAPDVAGTLSLPDPDQAKETPSRPVTAEFEQTQSSLVQGHARVTRRVLVRGAIDEAQFVRNLDTSALQMIAEEIQSLLAEIEEKERADPQYVFEGRWNQDFRASEHYHAVLGLGLAAIKPAYYIIYKSEYAGLYEYILASAIDELSGYEYAVTQDRTWATSRQFLQMYNDKVTHTLASFSEIVANADLAEPDKVNDIRQLGIFAVAPLLNELDDPDPAMSPCALEDCIRSIVEDHTGERVGESLDSWRAEKEQVYWDIIEIMAW